MSIIFLEMPGSGITIVRPNVIGIRYVGYGIVLFNLIYLFVLCIIAPAFVSLVIDFYAFFLLYVLALVAAAFGLKDQKEFLLYPVLITTVPFFVIPFFIWCFYITNGVYCAFNEDNGDEIMTYAQLTNEQMNEFMQTAFLNCFVRVSTSHGWSLIEISILVSSVYLLVFIEKLVEFLVFRKIMKLFRLAKVQAAAVVANGGKRRISEIFSDMNDSDDD
uniref:Uncharacterized protein n=1 Tax=Acrobeloides nanus TaxID=290746 RepID=A0A914CI03_9BILA